MSSEKTDYEFYAQIGIVLVLAVILLYNIGGSSNTASTGLVSASSVIPMGVPAVYGNELGITYDDVSVNNAKKTEQTITLLGNIDRIETLSGSDLERYIDILYNQHKGISCEYCCGARAIIFENGEPACGCAHSYAMRGLTKYLIKYHGDEMTDDEILTEAAKWKVLFFPGIMQGKADIMKSYGIETSYINLSTNAYRGIEQGQASGGMVGGC
jgi:hypothetical protein